MPCLFLMCRLIRANRQTGRNSLSNSIQTPWGQPEPATRDLHSKAGSPRRQAQPVSSPDGPAAADRFASSQDALNTVCNMRLPVCWCLACMDVRLLQLGPEPIAVVQDHEHFAQGYWWIRLHSPAHGVELLLGLNIFACVIPGTGCSDAQRIWLWCLSSRGQPSQQVLGCRILAHTCSAAQSEKLESGGAH